MLDLVLFLLAEVLANLREIENKFAKLAGDQIVNFLEVHPVELSSICEKLILANREVDRDQLHD